MRIALKIIIGIIVFGFIGGCIYIAGGISAIYPPIRKYEFNGSVEQFGNAIRGMAFSDSVINLKISRRDSISDYDGSRDMVLKIRKDTMNVFYDLVCKKQTVKLKLSLLEHIIIIIRSVVTEQKMVE